MNHLLKYGVDLIAKGYNIIPLVDRKKFPKEREWQKIKAKPSDVPEWVEKGYTGIGVLCAKTPAVDLDIRDKKLSIWMKDQVQAIAGVGPIRVGMAPKALLPFKTLKSFSKMSSKKFKSPDENLHQVEILGKGNQWVAYGIHPETNKEYKWSEPLVNIPWDDLPTLGRVQAQEIINVFEMKCRELGWKIHGSKLEVPAVGGNPRLQAETCQTAGASSKSEASEPGSSAPFIEGSEASSNPATPPLPNPATPTSVFPEVEGEAGVGNDAASPYRTFEEYDKAQDADPGRLQIENYVINRALNDVDPEEYEDWLKVGMALYHQFGGTEEGKETWATWSSQSGKFDPAIIDEKWPTFAAEPGRRPTTFRTVLKMAEKTRKEKDVLQEYLDRYVYIESEDTVHDLYGPPHKPSPILKNFRTRTAPDQLEVLVPAPLKDDPERRVPKIFPVVALWLKHGDRKWVSGEIYYPNNGEENRIRGVGGYDYLNTFRMPSFPKPVLHSKEGPQAELMNAPAGELLYPLGSSSRGADGPLMGPLHPQAIRPFLNHMEYLFPVPEESEWFIDWMALNIQHPDRRCKVTPLHISLHHGTGRGWLVGLLGKLLGGWNCTKTKMTDIIEGSWGNYLDRSLLCCVEEVHEGSRPYEVSEALRDILTEDTLQLNMKYGGIETKRVYTNFFFMSNRADALVLGDTDRRINVFKLIAEPRDRGYYMDLYRWSKGRGEGTDEEVPTAGVCALWHWLASRDLSSFNWQDSLKSDSRRSLIWNSENKVEMYFREIIKEMPGRVITVRMLKQIMGIKAESEGDDPWQFESGKIDRQLTKMLQQNGGVAGGVVKVTPGLHRPWILGSEGGNSVEFLKKSILKMEKWILEKKEEKVKKEV